jgi:hypothetical protein
MNMVTISVELSNELARAVLPLQDRLPEIIELGLRQWAAEPTQQTDNAHAKRQILRVLASTGIVTLPKATAGRNAQARRSPIAAGGPSASSLILAERRREA